MISKYNTITNVEDKDELHVGIWGRKNKIFLPHKPGLLQLQITGLPLDARLRNFCSASVQCRWKPAVQLREPPHEWLVLVQQTQHLHEIHTYGKKLRTPDCQICKNELGLDARGRGTGRGALLQRTVTVYGTVHPRVQQPGLGFLGAPPLFIQPLRWAALGPTLGAPFGPKWPISAPKPSLIRISSLSDFFPSNV